LQVYYLVTSSGTRPSTLESLKTIAGYYLGILPLAITTRHYPSP